MKNSVLKVHPADNVLVALKNLPKATEISWEEQPLVLTEDIPAKHKIYLETMQPGSKVVMYGVTVGIIQQPVQRGARMSTENIKHSTDGFSYKESNYQWTPPDVQKFANRTFKGYKRSDGRYGTANYWLFMPTVFCENRNLDVIKDALHSQLGYAVSDQYKSFAGALATAYQQQQSVTEIDFEETTTQTKTKRVFDNIDGIKFLNHTGGCGGTRDDAAVLGKLLAAYADHPNVAGITLLSLGCQNLQIQDVQHYLKERNPLFNKPFLIFEQQSSKSECELIATAIQQTFVYLIEANKITREDAPLSALNIGVKCGGSDGFSGISANPAVGYCADMVVALGGTILLAEFPELCGAEQELIDRAVDEPTAQKFIHLMTEYNKRAHAVGSGFHMNPSPGNIKDGLITDAIKSTGACRKGGTSPVVAVLDYTESAIKPGLNLVCTPGNDVEATTGKAASGATLILFTTGLGTPTGNPVCPVIKVSTNTALAKKMGDIIDIDTGSIIDGEKTIEEMGEEILEYIIEAASGIVIPKAVLLNQDDFIPWKQGVSL